MYSKIRKSRKAVEPTASSSAVIILIVAALIIGYLLAISPSERQTLLDGDPSLKDNTVTFNNPASTEQTQLLRENIGKLIKSGSAEKDYEMSALTVSTSTNAEAVVEQSSLYVRNSAFTKNFPELNFDLDPLNTNNLKLSFNTETAKGILMIYLNGNEIFAGQIKYTSPPAIEIPTKYIEEENILLFYLNRPSWAFWRIEEYELRDVKIFGDVTDISKDSAQTEFAITNSDYDLIESSKLYFFPECNLAKAGKLSIYLNKLKIYSALPDCGVINHIILDTSILESGRNSLSFSTEAGTYLLDQIKVRADFEDTTYPVYYFDLKDKLFFDADIEDDDDEDYKYFCDDDGEGILLRYYGETEETGWVCDEYENCLGNFEYYAEEKSKSIIVNKLCEELNDDEYKYLCDEDDKTILFKYEDELEDTGWNCLSGKTCEDELKIYDREKIKEIVLDDLCYYKDDYSDDDDEDYKLRTDYDVKVYMRFPDTDFKEITVWVNGYRKIVSTHDTEYSFYIDDYVFPGSNAIELEPETNDVRISELKIELLDN
jgi:hypothetical protein